MPPYRGRQDFPPWVPDISDQKPGVTADVFNVLPINSGWGPFPSFTALTGSLPEICRGFFYGRNQDGSVTVFAGSASARLYKLDNTSFTWIDVSQGGVAYNPLDFNRHWEFAQFNNVIIAVSGRNNPQAFTLGVSTTFADLGGNPPQADFISIVNRFVVLSGIPANPYRLVWSDLDNIVQWTAGVGQSDFQDLPDGGRTLGIAGFDLYAVIFQDSIARLMTYAPGSPVIFTITKITGGDGNGLFAPYGWEIDQDNVFWCSQEGFKMLQPGGVPVAIGKEIIDRYFFGLVDTGNLHLIISTTDPAASRLYIGFKTLAGQANQFDQILIYDWRLQRWSRIQSSGQYLTTMVRPGATLEGMDLPTPGAVMITGAAAAGGAGSAIRLQVSTTAGMSTAPQQTVYGKWNVTLVNGTAPFLAAINNVQNHPVGAGGAWGSWPISIVDGTHVDLVGSVFAGAYTSGGILGANIELLPSSFDVISTSSLPSLSAFNTMGQMGFFNGANLEAIIETGEQGTPEKRMFVRGFRCISDAPTIFGSVSYRDNPQANYNYTTEIGLDGFTGTILVAGGGIDTRYSRIKIRIPAGTVWAYVMSVEPDADLTGTY